MQNTKEKDINFYQTTGWWELAFANKPTQSEAKGHKCGENEMLILIAYDICDSKRLNQVAKYCENYGIRVQYSVFECRLEADVFERFWNGLQELIEPEQDRLVAYRICSQCAKNIYTAGTMTNYARVIAYIF